MTWSIEDARTKRRVDGQRRARLRTLVGRHLESPLRSVMSAAGAIQEIATIFWRWTGSPGG